MKLQSVFIVILFFFFGCQKISTPPEPFPPLPSERQLAWHGLEYYAFVHFNMNTFTNAEWGYGDESPKLFNPTELDTRQWARIAKAAGMKGIILTAKHHDGFCLWPSANTEHSVKNSPWKNGKGDVLKELAAACQEYGLKMGVYLSPWDRNHAQYGQPEYVECFHNQLRELLTNYGEVFEVWFDGANGGDGYYGGARETRKIDNKTYYQWDKVEAIVRELQPNACIFGDGGPDIRWVGNEEGWANKTNWSLLRKKEIDPGTPFYKQLRSGHENGTHWIPAECDVSIRPGWYYHSFEDHKVKSLKHLTDIYYGSIGRNAALLLNLPLDRRGLVHKKDEEQLMKLAATIKADFSKNIALGKNITATQVRGNDSSFSPSKMVDNNPSTYWTTDDSITTATLEIDLEAPTEINRILLQEYIPLGQRVKNFTLEAFNNEQWNRIDTGTTIGYKRIFRFPTLTASKVRINIKAALACPIISNLEIYHAPVLLAPPIIHRDKNGMIKITAADQNSVIYYTLDGTPPNLKSPIYQEEFLLQKPAMIQSFVVDEINKKQSEVSKVAFDIIKKDWKIVSVNGGKIENAKKLIDTNVQTNWDADNIKLPHEIVIDLGENYSLKGFTYLPMQDRWFHGIVTHYDFFVSKNGQQWGEKVASGEFSNIRNSPVLQRVVFPRKEGRFIKFRATKTMDEQQNRVTGAELGVVTE